MDKKMHIYESPMRSLVKSLTYRLLVLISDITIVSLITGQVSETLLIVVITNLSSTILYYLHERVWTKARWLILLFNHPKLRSAQLKKSVVKALSFRIVVVFSDFILATIITQSVPSALSVIIFTNIGSTIFYFVHEVIWNLILWGKEVHKVTLD